LGRDAGEDVGNYAITQGTLALSANYDLSFVEGSLEITKASTTITLANSIANCDGGQVTLTATVNTVNPSIQASVNNFGGLVSFKNGSTTIGTVAAASVSGGIFSGTFSINLPLGATYNISAEFVPNSGNLTGSQTNSNAQLTVLQASITSSVAPNGNGNVVIFDGAHSSMGLSSSTVLTATYQPSSYSGVAYKWYSRNIGGSFTLISGATSSAYTIIANGDFVKEYMVELIVNGNCVGNKIFSKVISVEASCGKEGQNKVAVCHVTPNGKRKTICVSYNAVDALLSGSPGSYVGDCSISYRMDKETELITVPWNTPLEVINEKIAAQSETWFNRKKIELNISAETYNPLKAGFYELQVDVEENESFMLEEPISVKVLVLDKPHALDITISNDKLTSEFQSGELIGSLSTVDPVDNIHTYEMEEHPDLILDGDKLIWRGTTVPMQLTFNVFSIDRAGQTISREIKLSRELKPGEFFLYPNPAHRETNVMVDMDREATVVIRIYDAIGRLVAENEAYREDSFTQTFNLDGLAAGLYTVQVKMGDLVMTKRLIKK
ncbi:T9SS type A sorting domain-containing protein, partial [Algoriphagus aestuariicola]